LLDARLPVGATPEHCRLKEDSFMRRLTWVALLAVLVAPAMFATGSSEDLAGQEIVVFTWDVAGPETSMVIQYVPEFTKATGIKVNYSAMGFGDVATKAATIFAAGSDAVDVIATWKSTINQFGAPGYLTDITDLLPKGYADGMTTALNSFKYKGRILGMPVMQSFRFFYYNKKLFKDAGLDPEKPPKTWAEAMQMAKTLTRDTNGDGKIDQWGMLPTGIGDADNSVMDFQLLYYLCGGGPLFDANDAPTFNSPAGVKALKTYKDMFDLGVVDPASWTIDTGNDRRARYIQGVTAMVIEWPATWKTVNNAAASKVKGDIGIAVMPMIDQPASISGDEGLSISKFSKKQKAALEFLKYLTSPAVNKDSVLRLGWLPVQKSVAADNDVRANPNLLPMLKVADEQNKYFMDRFAAPYSSEVEKEALGVALVKAVKGEMSPEEALKWAEAKSKEIVASYKK
jgi:ABC-type glycerol-3-phosphate transport system substrate-binding protein